MARRKDRPGPLEARSAAILRAIIEEYVATAQPVGSVALVEKYALSISPATVRNVMAELETAELLGHPHTSAGRIPTDRGYRLYVESISKVSTLAPVEQLMIRHQFGQVAFASEQWFRLAASALASATHAAAIATPAKPSTCRVRRIDVVGTAEHTASLVLVMADGPVKQVLLNLEDEYSQSELDELAGLLDRMLQGKATREVDAVTQALRSRPGERRCPAAAGHRACLTTDARVRLGSGRGGLQRGFVERHGGA